MGFWDYIPGVVKSLKQNSPDLTSVKNSVKNGDKALNKGWPDEESTSNIITAIAKHVAEEGIQLVPGGVPAYKVSTKSVHAAKKSEGCGVDVKELSAKVERLEKEVIERLERLKKDQHETVEDNKLQEHEVETNKPWMNSKL